MPELLQHLVQPHVQRSPELTAIVANDGCLSYGELDRQSTQLARMLRDMGCRRGDRVCFLIPKSPLAIVSILGILKADAAYVPLDTASPARRLAKAIASCEPRSVLTLGPRMALLAEVFAHLPQEAARPVVGVLDTATTDGGLAPLADFTWRDVQRQATTDLDSANTPDDLAYLFFTSGSTGTPKGVMITHANVWHFVQWANGYFGLDRDDRVSGHSPLHFDLSVYDVFGALAAGAELHLVPADTNLVPAQLASFIRERRLTQWFSVPSALTYMANFDAVQPNDFPDLRRVLWCGEVLPTPTLIYWMRRLPGVSFTNLYGPTETTIASSYYTVPQCPDDERAPIPIGTPCAGEDLLVLNDSFSPVPPGETGDLYVAGLGVGLGYWRDPAKTNDAFRPNPHGVGAYERMYRTGDLARIEEDGLVYFAGRADTQIKSRGYRIELGEIEAALHSIEALADGAIVAIESTGFEGKVLGCAYVPRPNHQITPAELRAQLAKELPSYMLPSVWMEYAQLPHNANGKVDRPQLQQELQAHGPTSARKPART